MSEVQPPRQSRLIVWAVVLLAAVVVGVLLWIFLRPPETARYTPLVQAAAHHTLPPDNSGRIDLSKAFPGITVDDTMCLRRWDDGRFAAFFPQFNAPGPSTEGVMYVSGPLQNDDMIRRSSQINFEKPMITIGTWTHMRIDKKLDDHWYRVSYGLE